jgi:hypothetical protein
MDIRAFPLFESRFRVEAPTVRRPRPRQSIGNEIGEVTLKFSLVAWLGSTGRRRASAGRRRTAAKPLQRHWKRVARDLHRFSGAGKAVTERTSGDVFSMN